MDEPLRLMRDYAAGKTTMRDLTVNGKLYYVFGELTAFAGDTLTSFRSETTDAGYYSLESIVNFWSRRKMPHSNYVREVSGRMIMVVTMMQRNALLQYLKGETDVLRGYDPNAPFAHGIPLAKLLQESQETGEPSAKRIKTDENELPGTSKEALEGAAGSNDGIRGLSSDLSAEKIAQLRTRVKKNLKQQVKPSLLTTLDADGVEPLAEIPYDIDADECLKALDECQMSSFSRLDLYNSTSSFDTVSSYFVEAKKNQQVATNRRQPLSQPNSQNRPTNGRSQTGYSRYDQEVFRAEPETDFQIETNLSFHGSTMTTIRGGAPKPASVVLNNSLNNTQSSNNDSFEGRNGFGPVSAIHPNGRPPKRASRTPIIIIPASGTALITMYNATDILQDLKYVPSDLKKKSMKRESEILIHRQKEGGSVPYRVMDDPRKLREEDWDRIVAVFVQGPAWQFKGWKYNQQPTEIFSKICAFHLKFEEQPLDKNVAGWSVNVLPLSKTKRHLDRAVLRKFWSTVDRFMVKNKPFLRF